MNRKTWIRNSIFIAAGLAFLPACDYFSNTDFIEFKNIDVGHRLQLLLSGMVDAIIPANDTKGAKDLILQNFVLKMIDECYEQHEQDMFVRGLDQIDDYCKQQTGSGFSGMDQGMQAMFLKKTAQDKSTPHDITYFLGTTKYLTVLSYTKSEYVMTDLIPYNIAPGYFHGCEEYYKF